jgi:hypothetical protein
VLHRTNVVVSSLETIKQAQFVTRIDNSLSSVVPESPRGALDLPGKANGEGSLRALVNEVPAPLVAEMLGYSYQVTQKHATAAAEPWSRYPGIKPARIMTDTIGMDR